MTSLIALKNVSYSYPGTDAGGRPALRDFDLEIEAGEYVAVVGANGSGKSTLTMLLNGLIAPDSGEVLIDGRSTAEPSHLEFIRETVGLVFQNPENQIVATTVADDIAFGPENLGLEPDEIERRVLATATRFQVDELLAREPHWLSGGQKQRVVLAGVMALQPRALGLDEPSTMLDPHSRERLSEIISGLRQSGITAVLVTQYMEEAVLAPRLVALAAGRKVYDGPPLEFFSSEALLEETGMRSPLAVRLSLALKRRGLELPPTGTLEELIEVAVCASN
jgi:energy-coupling factor transport system ATP-binding protein